MHASLTPLCAYTIAGDLQASPTSAFRWEFASEDPCHQTSHCRLSSPLSRRGARQNLFSGMSLRSGNA